MNNLNKKFIPKTETVIFPFANQHLIIPVQEQAVDFKKVFTVNDTGLELWQLLCKGISPKDILQRWKQEYHVEEEALLLSVRKFLIALKPVLNVKNR